MQNMYVCMHMPAFWGEGEEDPRHSEFLSEGSVTLKGFPDGGVI